MTAPAADGGAAVAGGPVVVAAPPPAAYAELVDRAMDAVVMLDDARRVVVFNPAAERLFGHAAATLLGGPLDRLLPAGQAGGHAAHVDAFAARGVTRRHGGALGLVHGVHADGHALALEVSLAGFTVDGRRFTAAVIRDLAPRLELERQQADLAASVPGLVCAFHLDAARGLRLVEVSPRLQALSGLELTDLDQAGRALRDHVAPADLGPIADGIATSARTLAPWHATFRYHHPTRGVRWIEAHAIPRLVIAGGVRWQGVATDVTERMVTERRLAIDAALGRILAGAVELADAGPALLAAVGGPLGCRAGIIWLVDRADQVLRSAAVWAADPAAAAFTAASERCVLPAGLGVAGAAWRTRAAVVDPIAGADDRERAELAVRHELVGGLAFPVLGIGEVTGVIELVGGGPLALDDDQRAWLGTVGSRCGQLVARGTAEEIARRLLALTGDAHYQLRLEADTARLVWASDRAGDVLGWPPAATGDTAWWLSQIHPDDRERIRASHRMPYDVPHQVVEYRFRRQDGRDVWLRDEKHLIRAATAGRAGEAIGRWTDVTARVELEGQLRQAQKMEAIGVLAGGVAHDFNNLLMVIGTSAELLRLEVPPGGSQAELIDEILEAGNRAVAVTRQLLLHSRAQVVMPQAVDADEAVRGLEKMLRRLIGEDVELTTELAGHGARVQIDPGQLEQCLLNLVVNGRDAMPQGGALTIATRLVEAGVDGRASPAHVMFTVNDTGCGIAPELIARIFEPFFTTKPVGKGTGLGLATVRTIVDQAGGWVGVTSSVGEGTTFSLCLPTVTRAAVGAPAAPVGSPDGHETVLVVDDDDAVRRVVVASLARHGYRVLEASRGAAALALLAERAAPVDLLLTDVILPGLDGRQLAERVVAAWPGTAVLYMSGYIDDAVLRRGVTTAPETFLNKPIALDVLLERVRAALDRPR